MKALAAQGGVRSVAAAVAFAACAGLSSIASAVGFSGDYTINALDNDPGLVIQTEALASPLNFNLSSIGGTHTVDLFRIWTDEKSANWSDDFASADISVDFTFTAPPGSGTVTGTTTAGTILFTSWGELKWDGPTDIAFGNGRTLTVSLTDETFNQGVGLELTPGYAHGATVQASFELSAIPLPAGLPLLVSGLGGLALLRRRRGAADA